jgi:hypothetical protein
MGRRSAVTGSGLTGAETCGNSVGIKIPARLESHVPLLPGEPNMPVRRDHRNGVRIPQIQSVEHGVVSGARRSSRIVVLPQKAPRATAYRPCGVRVTGSHRALPHASAGLASLLNQRGLSRRQLACPGAHSCKRLRGLNRLAGSANRGLEWYQLMAPSGEAGSVPRVHRATPKPRY